MSGKPVLVVMAAGMGSRYGGLKQIEPMGSCGEALLDYSIYDAWQAGFETVVIIIKKAIEEDFMALVGERLKAAPVEILYAYQELDKLPAGLTVPEGRVKPWGTSHAVLCAREAIGDAPFVVLNADDYYGKEAYRRMYEALIQGDTGESFMMGYELGNTVTENGSVTRGVCAMDENHYLTEIVERKRIEKQEDGIRFTEDGGETWEALAPDALVSMNMWGFHPEILDVIEKDFAAYMAKAMERDPMKCESILPNTVQHALKEGKAKVRVLSTPDSWYGVTYVADKPQVVAALREKTRAGLYPDGLWKK